MHSLKTHFPRIGMRIVKSSLTVGLCLLIYYIAGMRSIPFFLIIAALQSMQPYQKEIKEIAKLNVFGTIVGASCALVILLMQHYLFRLEQSQYLWYCFFVALGVLVSLYSCVVLGHGEAAYFTTVVYLCIVMVHMENEDPFLYVLNRSCETLVGIAIGTAINSLHIPRNRVKDTLFVAALDDVLHSESSILPEYSKVELNRILDDGVRLSIITQHSSASFWEAAGSIRFKMPVILLDGAVLYDPSEKRYISKVELSHGEAQRITRLLEDEELSMFQSCIIDDSVLIFYQHISDDCSALFEQMRKSNYRNYIRSSLPEGMSIIYLFCMGSEAKLDEAQEKIKAAGLENEYKLMRYKFHDHPGMGYMRIYSTEANRQNMLEKLRQVCGMEKLRSFGNDSELYDVRVRTEEGETILKALKKEAEPYFWQRKK